MNNTFVLEDDPRRLNTFGLDIFQRANNIENARLRARLADTVARLTYAKVLDWAVDNNIASDTLTAFLTCRKGQVPVRNQGSPHVNLPPVVRHITPDDMCDSNMAIAEAMTECGLPVLKMVASRTEPLTGEDEMPAIPQWLESTWGFVADALLNLDWQKVIAGQGAFMVTSHEGKSGWVQPGYEVFVEKDFFPLWSQEKNEPSAVKFLEFSTTPDGPRVFHAANGYNIIKLKPVENLRS